MKMQRQQQQQPTRRGKPKTIKRTDRLQLRYSIWFDWIWFLYNANEASKVEYIACICPSFSLFLSFEHLMSCKTHIYTMPDALATRAHTHKPGPHCKWRNVRFNLSECMRTTWMARIKYVLGALTKWTGLAEKKNNQQKPNTIHTRTHIKQPNGVK